MCAVRSRCSCNEAEVNGLLCICGGLVSLTFPRTSMSKMAIEKKKEVDRARNGDDCVRIDSRRAKQ